MNKSQDRKQKEDKKQGKEKWKIEKQDKKTKRKKLCKYHANNIECPFQEKCYYIHDEMIRKYIIWIKTKTRKGEEWDKTEVEERLRKKDENEDYFKMRKILVNKCPNAPY